MNNNNDYGQYYDSIAYNNYILTQNIAYLSSLPIHNFQQIQKDNYELNMENIKLKQDLIKLNESKNQSSFSSPGQIRFVINKIPSETNGANGANGVNLGCAVNSTNSTNSTNKKKETIRFRSILFKPNSDSWSNEEIKKKISSIKSIDDIIGLDNYWAKLRHNITLQRLYYLIPPLIKLKNMVGLDNIKQDVFKKIIYYIQNPHNEEYLHTIISGPPGVGKTEFAKIYAGIFVRLGILKSDKFIEIKRDDLVGQYLGQTAHRTRKLLDDAMGGVLFLDEAYSLGNKELRDSFSKEAIDMLNQYLSEQKGKFMFIIAGYEEDLDSCLFAYNRGMKRRFHSHYKIKGYEPKELREIFISKINQTPFKISVDTQILDKFFVDNKKYFKYFAGDVEKLINEIKQVQSFRAFNQQIENKDIILEDINTSLKNLEEKDKETSSPPEGMYL